MIAFNSPEEQPKSGLTFTKLMKVKKMFEDSEKEQAKLFAACDHFFEPHPFQLNCSVCYKCGLAQFKD